MKIATQVSIPNPLVYTINAIIIIIKLILLVSEGKRLYAHHSLSKEIKYDKNIKIRKYVHLLLSLFAVISYFGQYCSEEYYGITFLL
jgi:hypothetical protein